MRRAYDQPTGSVLRIAGESKPGSSVLRLHPSLHGSECCDAIGIINEELEKIRQSLIFSYKHIAKRKIRSQMEIATIVLPDAGLRTRGALMDIDVLGQQVVEQRRAQSLRICGRPRAKHNRLRNPELLADLSGSYFADAVPLQVVRYLAGISKRGRPVSKPRGAKGEGTSPAKHGKRA